MNAATTAMMATAMLLALTTAANAQSMQAMPGMTMPMKLKPKMTPPKTAPPPKKATPAKPGAPAGTTPAQHDMASMPGMTSMPQQAAGEASGTKAVEGNAPPPPAPAEFAADRVFDPAQMQRARDELRKESGGQNYAMILFNLAEVQIRDGKDGYRWDGEGWYGGDINRLVIKTQGDGSFKDGVGSAEVQALYSRAIGPFYNLQAGMRHDLQPSPTRTYATIGVEGLAPYMFDTEAALFLSTKGDLFGRTEGWYDQRITQRLILQPRVELNFAAQNVPEDRIGAGLSQAELGLRLRYEIKREFAPYVGISYESRVGRTATFARRDGEAVHSTSLVFGIRTWF